MLWHNLLNQTIKLTAMPVITRRKMNGRHTRWGCSGSPSRIVPPTAAARRQHQKKLVPQGAEMEDAVRGPDQRAQTTARAQPQPLSGRGRDGKVGRIRGSRRHADQYGKSFGKSEEWISRTAPWGEKNKRTSPRATEKARGSTTAYSGKAPDLSRTTLGPLEASFLRRKVASSGPPLCWGLIFAI